MTDVGLIGIIITSIIMNCVIAALVAKEVEGVKFEDAFCGQSTG